MFATTGTFCQTAQQSQPASVPKQPETLVRSLYTQVVARHPIGIPKGEDWKVFAPYLSKTLLHKIDLGRACGADWYRQNPDPSLKPDIGWLELGLFSGDDEPTAFRIERAQSETDDSIRVYVKLIYEEPHAKPLIWYVAAILLRENGHYVLDDVLYLKEKGKSEDARLSARLSAGCDGARWIGYGQH
jgi:hypothetical protein